LNKILIVKPSSLGDVVHAIRVVRQIKLKIPDCEIHWVIKDGLEGILDSVQWIDRYFILERGKGLFPYLRLISEIRKCEYDYCLDLQGLLRSSIIAKFSRSKIKLGRADGRECSTLFYRSVGCPSRKTEIHAIERLTSFLHELGITKYDRNLPLEFKKLSSNFIIPAESIILFPESRRKEKIWPYFAELAVWLKKEFSKSVLIAGNQKDGSFPSCIDYRGEIDLALLPYIVSQSSIIVCNDSAPLHIASAVGTKTVALFGPTEPLRYGPYPVEADSDYTLCSKSKKIADIHIDEVKVVLRKAIT
jgi:heptosyltransferase-1